MGYDLSPRLHLNNIAVRISDDQEFIEANLRNSCECGTRYLGILNAEWVRQRPLEIGHLANGFENSDSKAFHALLSHTRIWYDESDVREGVNDLLGSGNRRLMR